jgi:hypothetical protein
VPRAAHGAAANADTRAVLTATQSDHQARPGKHVIGIRKHRWQPVEPPVPVQLEPARF